MNNIDFIKNKAGKVSVDTLIRETGLDPDEVINILKELKLNRYYHKEAWTLAEEQYLIKKYKGELTTAIKRRFKHRTFWAIKNKIKEMRKNGKLNYDSIE